MRGNELLDNMELVDAAYVEAADAAPKKKTWIRWTAIAASLCLIMGVLFGFGLLKHPGVKTNDYTDIAYYELQDLLGREDFASIIWGTNEDHAAEDKDPNQSGGGDNICLPEEDTWTQWNGIHISSGLQAAMEQLNADDVIAIGVDTRADPALLYDDYVPLDAYIYNGKTYAELHTAYAKADETHDDLVDLKKFSGFYDEWEAKDDAEFWAKLYDIVPEETVLKYFQGDKASGKFNTTAISDDLNACETEKLRLENDMAACRREYSAKFSAVPDLSQMMNKGYYVVGNGRVFAVILPVGQMSQFADDAKVQYGEDVLESAVFRMATRSELGVEDLTDEPEIVPGGIVEEPVSDDVMPDDDIPVNNAE